jgi:hypothetical protein
MNLELSTKGESSAQAELQELPSVPVSRTKKPRALVIKANNKDFDEITEVIKSQFSDVQILYITTGPVASILRVTKSVPFELQNSPKQF